MTLKFWRTIILFLTFYQQISSIPLTLINNAIFSPNNITNLLTNFSNIQSRDACICQCYGTSQCIMVNYNGYRRECLLVSATFRTEHLRTVPSSENATVVIFNDRNQIGKETFL